VSGHAKMPPASHQVSVTSLKLLKQQIHVGTNLGDRIGFETFDWLYSESLTKTTKKYFGLLNHVLPGPNERLAGIKSMVLS
jgi:L-ribulose-5-phosphate 3-epimerase UlaE